jgi:hypothetical protein
MARSDDRGRTAVRRGGARIASTAADVVNLLDDLREDQGCRELTVHRACRRTPLRRTNDRPAAGG